jgi:hypothetical protein
MGGTRDGAGPNIMVGPGAFPPEGYLSFVHRFTTTREPEALSIPQHQTAVRYFLVDFSISVIFPDKKSRAKVLGTYGREKTTPELSNSVPYDPFPVDIYIAGKLLQSVCVST